MVQTFLYETLFVNVLHRCKRIIFGAFVGERRKKRKNGDRKRMMGCGERGSNTRPSDLQSDALPTELSPP
ncbi:hypothetical protein DKX38_016706 [Salix brachista]|uniref:Uncharacterized protein n=1 Tax=Salix brachista TaxID=2182728 RepID=A0A5N5L8P7_9ROSI|nr:hypothetical protein DKX38_016706 [Salix brachista]